MRQFLRCGTCGANGTNTLVSALRQQQQQQPPISTCVTVPLRTKLQTPVSRKYEESTSVSDIVCASCTSGLTLSSTIHDLCTTLGMMPMPQTVQQFAHESIGYLLSHYSPSQRRPIAEHFAGAPVYRSLRDIASMHKRDIWTLSDAAGAGGLSLPKGLSLRTEQLMLRAIQDADMNRAQYTEKHRYTLSYAKDLYRAITTATYSAYSVADEKADQIHGSDGMGSGWATNEVLRVLTIGKDLDVGWPADIRRRERQLFVRKEYDRIFDALFKPTTTGDTRDGRSGMAGTRSLDSNDAYITGTPGIGKTYMSSYYLWRLLSLDEVVGLRYVLYCAWSFAYIFDKTNRTATIYLYEECINAKPDFLSMCEVSEKQKGIVLFNCSHGRHVPMGMHIPTIVFGCPYDTSRYMELYIDSRIASYTVNVWEAPELCAWSLSMRLRWSDIKERYEAVGGVPQFFVSDTAYTNRCKEIEMALYDDDMLLSLANGLSGKPEEFSSTLTLLKPLIPAIFKYENGPRSDTIVELIMARVRQLRTLDYALCCYYILSGRVYGKVFRATFLEVCWRPPLAKMMLVKCQPLVSPKDANKKVDKIAARSKKAVAIKAMEADLTLLRKRLVWTQANPTKITAGVLYVPESQTFPLVDAFMLVKDVFICIQMTTSRQEPATDGLKDFKKIYDKMNISPKHKVIVYVQPPTVPCITTVQWPSDGCDGAGLLSFWADFSQYTFIVDDEFCKRVRDLHDPSIAKL